jgi:carboxymethylenebutenolidase
MTHMGERPIQVEELLLPVGDDTVPAWLYRPEGGEGRAAFAIGAEATGVNRFIHQVAADLAGLGYVTLVPDYYRGAGPADAEDYGDIDEIMRHIGTLDFRRGTHDLTAAVDFLQRHPAVDPGRVGVWGYCTGGTLALLTACLRPDLAAAVLFYPSQPVFATLSVDRPSHPMDLVWNIGCPTFFVYGEKDPVMQPHRLAELRRRLEQWRIDHTIRLFPGCGHSFGAPIPDVHDPAAYEQAWREAVAFAAAHVGRPEADRPDGAVTR